MSCRFGDVASQKIVWIAQTKIGYHGNVPWAIATQFHSNHLYLQRYPEKNW